MIQANCCTCIEIATQLQQEVKGFQLHDKKNSIWKSTNNQKKPTQSVLFTRQLHLLNIWVMRSETARFSCTWHLSYEIDILFKMYEYNFIKCALCTPIVKHWQNQNDGTLWPKPEHCTNIQMQIDHRNTKHTHTPDTIEVHICTSVLGIFWLTSHRLHPPQLHAHLALQWDRCCE